MSNASTNQITNSGYTYDASGDLTNDGAHSYQYDAEGRLVSVDNGVTASYVYNALGERVEEDAGGTYSEYVFDKDGNPQPDSGRAELSFSRRRESSLWAPAFAGATTGGGQHIAHYENGETYFVHSGRLGTAGIVTDYTGAVIQDELHYPWGRVWTTMGAQTEERFASLNHRDSATNLDPTHFRMYSSDQGRWMTPDPAPNCPYHPTNFDRYNYAANNPTNNIDPQGTQPFLDFTPFPQTQEFQCEECRFGCKFEYTAYLMGCVGLVESRLTGIFGFVRCQRQALAQFTDCMLGCENGPCDYGNNFYDLEFPF